MISADTQGETTRVRYGDLHRFSGLFRTYCDDYASLDAFFSGDFRNAASLDQAAARASAFNRDRETLVSVLQRQNEQWGAQEHTRKNISRLLDPNAVAVVTGQQVGLLTGPLYTVLKTITAVQVARELEARTGRPCIPVFWLEGEDHDVEEATSIAIPTDSGPARIAYAPASKSGAINTGPVGRLRLDEGFAEFASQVEELLPPTEFRDAVMQAVKDSYEQGETLLCGFARYLRTLFPDEGLVFLSSDDPALKTLLGPLFQRELEDPNGSYAALADATDRLPDQYAAQIAPKPGNLFVIEEEGRLRLEPSSVGYNIRGLDRSHQVEEMVAELKRNPSRFSPNVALRPLAQDTLLPTAVYIAGPGEIAYFAQLKGLYEWAGIPMPVIYPRASVTFVEARIRRVLDRYELDVPALATDIDAVVKETVLAGFDVDVEAVFDETERTVAAAIQQLKPMVEGIDKSLVKSVDATTAGIAKQIQGLKGRTIRSARRVQDQTAEAIQRAGHHLFPDRNLQERVVSPTYLMTKYGTDLLVRLISELSTDTTDHQVVEIVGSRA